MRRWETLTALAAVIIASIGAFPIAGRLWFALFAILALAIVGAAQVRRALTKNSQPPGGLSAEERARRIREQRNRR
jgi:membrane protein implicated in regulation of membrane protease activity